MKRKWYIQVPELNISFSSGVRVNKWKNFSRTELTIQNENKNKNHIHINYISVFKFYRVGRKKKKKNT